MDTEPADTSVDIVDLAFDGALAEHSPPGIEATAEEQAIVYHVQEAVDAFTAQHPDWKQHEERMVKLAASGKFQPGNSPVGGFMETLLAEAAQEASAPAENRDALDAKVDGIIRGAINKARGKR